MNDLPKWKTTGSKYIVNDRWLKLRADSCVAPDGRTIDPFYVIEYPDWINCLVLDDEENVIMLRHYRYGADVHTLEIVGGSIDPKDASPKAAAQRELEEELGYVGGTMYATGVCYANPAMMPTKNYCFLAVGGRCTNVQQLDAGENFIIERYKFPEFLKRVQDPDSEVYQTLHLTNIFFALNFIKDSSEEALQPLKKYL